MGQNIHRVVTGTDPLSRAEGAEDARSQAILDEYEKLVPWYRDPWHAARVLLAALIGLGLSYVFGGNQVLFDGVLALAIAVIAVYAALYVLVVWRTRLLVRKADRVFGRVHPPGSGQHPTTDAEPVSTVADPGRM